MSYIGFERDTGHVYEGAGAPQFAIWPNPVLSQVKLIDEPGDWNELPRGIEQTPFAWVFREDLFDSVTRIRRGRLYEPYPSVQPGSWPVSAHPYDHDGMRQVAAGGHLKKQLFAYWPCQAFLSRKDRGLGTTLALGQGNTASLWRVIQTEMIVGNDVMITLKALSAYGILPTLDLTSLDEGGRQSVSRALERVSDAAFRETPISLIDQCRNAATVVLARWLIGNGGESQLLSRDLGELAKVIANEPHKKIAARDAAEVIRRLHPRGKANEQESKGLRLPVEEDGELSIHALGFLLRELGWTK